MITGCCYAPLWDLAQQGRAAAIQALMQTPPWCRTPRWHGREGLSELAVAVWNDHAEAVRMLVGPSTTTHLVDADDTGFSLMHLSACVGSASAARVLMDLKADLHARVQGAELIHVAASRGHIDVVQLLLLAKVGADTATVPHGCTPSLMATCHGHTDTLRLLLRAKADANRANAIDGTTPTHVASSGGHVDALRLLLLSKADAGRATYPSNITPTHNAVRYGHSAVLQMLLRANADVNISTSDGKTPGYFATRALLQSKGDPDHLNGAVLDSSGQCLRLLLQAKARVEYTPTAKFIRYE